MSNKTYQIHPESYSPPRLFEGFDANNPREVDEVEADSEPHFLWVTEQQMEADRKLLSAAHPEDACFGIDVDSGVVLVVLDIPADADPYEAWRNEEHDVVYSFDLKGARQIYGVEPLGA